LEQITTTVGQRVFSLKASLETLANLEEKLVDKGVDMGEYSTEFIAVMIRHIDEMNIRWGEVGSEKVKFFQEVCFYCYKI
jgi:hypothetical protein